MIKVRGFSLTKLRGSIYAKRVNRRTFSRRFNALTGLNRIIF